MSVSKADFGVDNVINARDMTISNVDPIGVMAYAAWLQAKAFGKHNTVSFPSQPALQDVIIPLHLEKPPLEMLDTARQISSPQRHQFPLAPSAPALLEREIWEYTIPEAVTSSVALMQPPILVETRVVMVDRWTIGSLATFLVCHPFFLYCTLYLSKYLRSELF